MFSLMGAKSQDWEDTGIWPDREIMFTRAQTKHVCFLSFAAKLHEEAQS